MTEARTFKYKTNLSKQMSQPGGRSIEDAVRRADAALDGHREAGMLAVTTALGELEAACRARDDADHGRVYEMAAALLDMAGFFDTGPLYGAAYSLCEITDLMLASGAWTWPSVDVHVRALRLILADGCVEGETSAALLAGLRSVVARSRQE